VRVSAAEAEIARAQFLSLVPEGFEELESGAVIELATYTDERGEARIRASFPSVHAAPVEPGWEDGWRAFHHAVHVGGLWIGPPWETAPAGEPTVVIEPGRAFGTGAHPTTRACIELLSTVGRGSLLDAGCGSGVVAIAAARLGFGPVVAVDVDEIAVAVTRENARRNGISLEVQSLDVLIDDLPRTDVAVANIELAAVEALLARRSAPRAISSGYLTRESPKAEGWRQEERLELDGWAADLFIRVE
jgi:ribosomal protein L11 methyltransferase